MQDQRRFILILLGLALLMFTAAGRSVPAAEPSGTVSFPEMVTIQAGDFLMGDHYGYVDPSHPSDETPIHTVRLSAYSIGRYNVTVGQYCEFLNSALTLGLIQVSSGIVYLTGGSDPLFLTRQADPYSRIGYSGGTFSVLDNRGEHPVTSVLWHGAAAYCNWLSDRAGLDRSYDPATWNCDFSKSGYRLPTEAEWEYAARGGQNNPYFIFPWGNTMDTTKANIPNSGDPFETGLLPWTTPVGFYNGQVRQKSDFSWPGSQASYSTSDGVNGFGLYDMAGNVWQWCNDWYGQAYYSVSPSQDPTGPATGTSMPDGKSYRVLRGGNWYNGEDGHARVSNRDPAYYRGPQDPNHPYYHVGFRVVSRGAATCGSAQTVGVFVNDPRAWEGYTLFAPKHYGSTYLINNEGRLVHSWAGSKYEPGQSVYLLENGHLLRSCMVKGQLSSGGGEGGRIEEYDWDGNLVWEFDYSSSQYTQHHDIKPLPNGNILMLVVEKKTYDEAIAAGFNPSQLQPQIQQQGYMLPDSIVEIQPVRPSGGTVAWSWHVWDHLIQDYSSSKANYGNVAEHPELIHPGADGSKIPSFWNHMNAIYYNPALDQIILSVRGNSEVWVIDHSTTTAQAAGHTGGRYGKGGDLLYRWGNPIMYRAGTKSDQKLYQQHDAQWIDTGCPGAGNILVFNNGLGRNYSTADEFTPPVDANGNYALTPGSAYGPKDFTWSYKADPPGELYAEAISSAQRLPNGNTLICDGTHGTFIEVTPAGETVWEYVNPVVLTGPLTQGDAIPPDPARADEFMNAVFRVRRYAPDYPGLAGRNLTPGETVEKQEYTYTLSKTHQSFDWSGGTDSVGVATQSSCSWTANSNAGWITITSGSSGTGNGTVNYTVSANTGSSARTGTMTIAGQTFTVNQSGSCTFTLSKTQQSFDWSGGTDSAGVTTQSGCSWTASSSAGWITITSGGSGTGDGTVSYSVSTNTSGSPRTGALTIAGQAFTVTQSAVQNAPDLTGLWTTPLTQACMTLGQNRRCTLKGVLTVTNVGSRDAPSASVGLYLSDNNGLEEGDTLLKSFATGTIKAGKSKLIRFNYTFPTGKSATGKYVIAVIDKEGRVVETNETNNTVVQGPFQ